MTDPAGATERTPVTVTTRQPADVLRTAVGAASVLLLVLAGLLFGDAFVGFVSDLLSGLEAVPDWLLSTAVVVIRVVAVVVLLAGVIATALRSGGRMIAMVVVAGVVAAVAVALLSDALPPDPVEAPVELSIDFGPLGDERFPSLEGLAAAAALVSAAAPWLSRRWRRWGWVAVCGLVVVRFLTAPTDFDSVAAALLGWTVGSAALVAFGAPSRHPTAASISAGLARCGVELAELKAADVDARGSTPYLGKGVDGTPYFVKAVGDDERSADLLFRAYRYVQRANLGDERPFSSLRRAVEHEAFVSMAAQRRGVLTPDVVAFASAEPHAFVLAYSAVDGKSLDSVPVDEVTDEILDQVWAHIVELHAARIAHRDLRLANVFLDVERRVWMIDFGFSEVAASDLLLATDVAELIASSSTVVGPERAVARAAASIDRATLDAAYERLQYATLSGATRTALKSQPGALEELRDRVSNA